MTEYNKLVDHLVSTMKSNSSVKDVTNSVADWTDFWYNSKEDLPDWTNNETPPITPMKVTKKDRKSFDELYEEYSSMSIEDQLNNLKQLGREFVTKIDQVINHLDVILDEEDRTVKDEHYKEDKTTD